MRLNEYQHLAAKTDQFPLKGKAAQEFSVAQLVPLLGLTGEVGALLSEYKKLLRDGPVHLRFRDRVQEELGDTLWYLAAVATKFDLSLDKIAESNLRKVADRWHHPRERRALDIGRKPRERLPRRFRYRFDYSMRRNGTLGVSLLDERGRQIGDPLTDNSHRKDGYRFHDVMHFAFVAVLGWSPVARKVLNRKRRSDESINEVEDGGRAAVIDEAIVAMVFDYIHHSLSAVDGMRRIDSETLRSIRALTRGLEVQRRTEAEWENAILQGLRVWRQVERHDGGSVAGDFRMGTFEFIAPGMRTIAARPRGERSRG